MSPRTSGTVRRSTTEDSRSRTALLDAAERLVLEEGYAAATARRVAAAAGLKPQLVHYYFSSMDELFVSLVRRGSDHSLDRLKVAIESPHPLRALWELSTDPVATALATEYISLAHHRKALAREIAKAGEKFRLAQRATMEHILDGYGVDRTRLSAGAALVALAGLARVIVMEQSIGMTTYHDEILGAIEALIDELEPMPSSALGAKKQSSPGPRESPTARRRRRS